jgi:hypothetical protein
VAAAGAAGEDRQVVADELAAKVGEDRNRVQKIAENQRVPYYRFRGGHSRTEAGFVRQASQNPVPM